MLQFLYFLVSPDPEQDEYEHLLEDESHTWVWSSNLLVVRPAAKSQSLKVLSHEPERA